MNVNFKILKLKVCHYKKKTVNLMNPVYGNFFKTVPGKIIFFGSPTHILISPKFSKSSK